MWLLHLKMPTQNFLMLLILLMLMLRNMLMTVWSRFWEWGLVDILNLNFGHYFEAYFWSSLWGWDLVKILKLKFGQDFKAEFCSSPQRWSLVKTLIWLINLNMNRINTLSKSIYQHTFINVLSNSNCNTIKAQRRVLERDKDKYKYKYKYMFV